MTISPSIDSSTDYLENICYYTLKALLYGTIYGTTAFTWIQTSAQITLFPYAVAVGVVAGLAFRGIKELLYTYSGILCCPCTLQSIFRHKIVGAIDSLAILSFANIGIHTPFSLGFYSGIMLGESFKTIIL